MATSLVVKGLPEKVPIHDLVYNLEKYLHTHEIGTVKVKVELLTKETNKSKQWQIAVDFKSAYDADAAHTIVQGFKYTWQDGDKYLVRCEVLHDLSVRTRRLTKANLRWGSGRHSSSCLDMSQEELRCRKDILNARIILKKQKLLWQTEREGLEAKRKLERQIRKRHHMSYLENEEIIIHRSRKEKRAKGTWKSRTRTTPGGSGSKHRSRSRSSYSSPQLTLSDENEANQDFIKTIKDATIYTATNIITNKKATRIDTVTSDESKPQPRNTEKIVKNPETEIDDDNTTEPANEENKTCPIIDQV